MRDTITKPEAMLLNMELRVDEKLEDAFTMYDEQMMQLDKKI